MTGIVLPYTRYSPEIGPAAVLAPDSAVIGRSVLGSGVVLQPFATLRADGEHIVVGDDVFFAARATVHIADGLLPSKVGNRVTVGRYALVHACTLGNNVVIGHGAAVMDGSVVGDDTVIAPGALVSPRKALEGGWLYDGAPAKAMHRVSAEEIQAAHLAIRRSDVASPATPDIPVADLSPWPVFADGRRLAPLGGAAPRVHPAAFVAPTAALAGDVRLEPESGVWFGCVLFAGDARIVVGARSNVQDNSLLLTDAARGPILIGSDVTIGHNVRMGACTVEDECLIGMGSQLEDGVIVERGACVGARAYVAAGTVVKAGMIWAGRPARSFRPVSDTEREEFQRGRTVYVRYTRDYRT